MFLVAQAAPLIIKQVAIQHKTHLNVQLVMSASVVILALAVVVVLQNHVHLVPVILLNRQHLV